MNLRIQVLLIASAFFALGNLSAQWTDSGSYLNTTDNVNIGAASNTYSLYVRKNKTGWQSNFYNSNGAGARILMAHGAGYGMHIKGYTTDNKYTLKLENLKGQTNVFYNNGKVALGLAGNVGIGTTSPREKLEVKNGYILATNHSPQILLRRNTDKGVYVQGIKTELNNGNSNWWFGNLHDQEWRVSKGDFDTNPVFRITATGNGYIKNDLDIGGNLNLDLGEGLTFTEDKNYWGTSYDARIIRMNDLNGANGNVDGGLVIEGYTPNDNVRKEIMTIRGNGDVNINGRLKLNNLLVNSFWQPGSLESNPGITYGSTSPVEYDDGNVYIGNNTGHPDWSEPIELRSKLYLSNNNDEMITFRRRLGDNDPGENIPDHTFVFKFGYDGNFILAKRNGPATNVDEVVWEVKEEGGGVPVMKVSGTLKVVAPGGPDYVFAEDYKLRSIEELEAYIEQHHHLPGVKSAREFEAENFDVVKDGFSMLEKIEELSLYTIQQEKELKAKTQKIEDMEKRLLKLEQILKN